MKKYLFPLLILVLALLAGLFVFLTRDSEEVKVKKVLGSLCRMASKSEGDNAAASALMISRTDRIFAGSFEINISNGMFNGVFNPTKMTSELARYRAVFAHVKVRTQDEEISFPSPDKAVVLFSGILDGTTKNGKSLSEARDVECYLSKTEKGWLITKMVIREILEK